MAPTKNQLQRSATLAALHAGKQSTPALVRLVVNHVYQELAPHLQVIPTLPPPDLLTTLNTLPVGAYFRAVEGGPLLRREFTKRFKDSHLIATFNTLGDCIYYPPDLRVFPAQKDGVFLT